VYFRKLVYEVYEECSGSGTAYIA